MNTPSPPTAWVFPGQGSQTPGMARKLLQEFPEVKANFVIASDYCGEDLLLLREQGPEHRLGLPHIAEPLLAATQIGFAQVLMHAGLSPAVCAGYSAGEVACFYAAGVLSLEDALAAAAIRGQVLKDACDPDSQMIAVSGCKWQKLETLVPAEVQVAAWNAPDAHTFVGPVAAIDGFLKTIAHLKAQVASVNVSGPWHSRSIQSTADEVATRLEALNFHSPNMPVLLSHTARECTEPAALRAGLAQQIAAPVQWQRTVSELWNSGIRNVVELGSGRVLQGYIRRNWLQFSNYTVTCVETSRGSIGPLKRLLKTPTQGTL